MGDGLSADILPAVAQGLLDSSGEAGELWPSIRNPTWRDDFAQRMADLVDQHIQHFISAAVRHDRIVLGYLRAYRTDCNRPYEVGDDDLIQVLADRIGSVITESPVRDELERQRSEHKALADRLQELTTEQRELLEQLANVEERERTLLAEAIHDGRMQLVVAVMMCLENSTINQGNIDGDEMERLIVTLETSIQGSEHRSSRSPHLISAMDWGWPCANLPRESSSEPTPGSPFSVKRMSSSRR